MSHLGLALEAEISAPPELPRDGPRAAKPGDAAAPRPGAGGAAARPPRRGGCILPWTLTSLLPIDTLPARTLSMTTIVELGRDEILTRLETGAQRRRGLSAKELVRRYRAGELEDPCEVADLLALADLLRDDDPLFVAA